MPASEMQLQVCQLCRFVLAKTLLSWLLPCRVLKRQSVNYRRQNLKSIQGKWNGHLPRNVAKDAERIRTSVMVQPIL